MLPTEFAQAHFFFPKQTEWTHNWGALATHDGGGGLFGHEQNPDLFYRQ
jgi:hypothetical protein